MATQLQKPPDSQSNPLFEPSISEWSQQIAKHQSYLDTIMTIFGVMGLIVGIVVGFTMPDFGVEGFWLIVMRFVTGIIVIGVVYGIGEVTMINPQRTRRIQEMMSAIRPVIESQGFKSSEVVSELARIQKTGDFRNKIMHEIDPSEAVLLINHDTVMRELTDFEKTATVTTAEGAIARGSSLANLQKKAQNYIAHGFYAEGISLMLVLQVTHHVLGLLATQVRIKQGNMIYTVDTPWKNFNYQSEITTLYDMMTKRQISLAMMDLLQQMVGGQEAATSLLDIEQVDNFHIRDAELVSKCAATALQHIAQTLSADDTMALLYSPDTATVANMVAAAFSMMPFAPKQIEACIRHGRAMQPYLEDMLRESNSNTRFNAALAAGSIQFESAKTLAENLLATHPDVISQIGAHYILARMGQPEHQQQIIPHLNDANADVSHAAAIALEHLPLPLPDDVLLAQFKNGQLLVRLRLVRHLKDYPTQNPDVIEAVAALILVPDKMVNEAAVETLATLESGDALYARAEVLQTKGAERMLVLELMTRSGNAQVINALQSEWSKSRSFSKQEDKAHKALSLLGQTRSAAVIPTLIEGFKNTTYQLSALNSLLQLSAHHPDAVREAVSKAPQDNARALLLLLLGDTSQIAYFQKQLTADFQTIASALNYVRFLGLPDFEKRVLELLGYSGATLAPQNHAIQHEAFKAWVAIHAKKGVDNPMLQAAAT